MHDGKHQRRENDVTNCSKQKFLILNDAIIEHLDQSECATRRINQSDLTFVRKREASKRRHQVFRYYAMGILNDSLFLTDQNGADRGAVIGSHVRHQS